MSIAAALALVIGAAVVAYAFRATIIVALSGVDIPPGIERVLGFIGPAVLASMTVNFAFGGEGGPHLGAAEILALLVALVAMIWKRNLLVMIAVAMPVLWGVGALT